MRIKKLFNNESEFLDFAWKFIRPDKNKIWRDEDLPLLKPYFDFSNGINPWTEEVEKSFEHYKKCKEEYNNELVEIKDSCSYIDEYNLFNVFFLHYPFYNETEEEIIITRNDLKISEEYKEEIIFPMIFIAFILSDWDRNGNYSIAISDFVSVKDFSNT